MKKTKCFKKYFVMICFVLMLRVCWGQDTTTQVGIVIGVSGNGSSSSLIIRTADGIIRMVDYRNIKSSQWVEVKA